MNACGRPRGTFACLSNDRVMDLEWWSSFLSRFRFVPLSWWLNARESSSFSALLAVDVAVGVAVGVMGGTGPTAQSVGLLMTLVSSVTAPLRASARPLTSRRSSR